MALGSPQGAGWLLCSTPVPGSGLRASLLHVPSRADPQPCQTMPMCLPGGDRTVLPAMVWHCPSDSCPRPAASPRALLQLHAGEVMGEEKSWQQDACQLPACSRNGSPSPASSSQLHAFSREWEQDPAQTIQKKQARKILKRGHRETFVSQVPHPVCWLLYSKGVFTAHPAWDGVWEACKTHMASAQAGGLALMGQNSPACSQGNHPTPKNKSST